MMCQCLWALQKHPVSVASISPCAIFTGLHHFQLVPVSTALGVEGLHHQKCIAVGMILCRSHMAHITHILGAYVHICPRYEVSVIKSVARRAVNR